MQATISTPPIPYSEFLGRDAPFMDDIGLMTFSDEQGVRVVTLTLLRRHLNAAMHTHGGVVLTLLDVAMGSASRLHGDSGRSTVTVEMKTSFLRPGGREGESISARGFVRHATRSLVFCEAELRGEDGVLLATASGTFKYMSGDLSSADG